MDLDFGVRKNHCVGRKGVESAIRAPGGETLEIKITVEDGLKEIIESPGAKQAIETAVHKQILVLKDVYWDRLSRQSVISRGFIGTDKV